MRVNATETFICLQQKSRKHVTLNNFSSAPSHLIGTFFDATH